MRSGLLRVSSIAPIFVLSLVWMSGCGDPQDDRQRIIGLWGMGHITSNGLVASEGKEWFEFHADGTVDSRTGPSSYQKGFWRLDQSTHRLTLGETGLDSLVYEYALEGDTLLMEATMAKNHHRVGIKLVPISKKPIEQSEEMGQVSSPDSVFVSDSSAHHP